MSFQPHNHPRAGVRRGALMCKWLNGLQQGCVIENALSWRHEISGQGDVGRRVELGIYEYSCYWLSEASRQAWLP